MRSGEGSAVRVLITGGSGFIGRNLVESLRERHEVLAPTHSELELTDHDAVHSYLAVHRPEVVVHGAVKPGHRAAKDRSGIAESNTAMFHNLADDPELCPRMVFLSSGAVYDERHYLPKMREIYLGTHVPTDPNGYAKYLAARWIESAEHVVELRPFGVYGSYEDYSIRFISNAICKALLGLPITLRQDRRFDYVWVGDLVRIVEYFIDRSRGELRYGAYNVTPDESENLTGIAHMVLEVTGVDVPIIIAMSGEGVEYSGDNTRLREEMPGLELTSLRYSIEMLVSWYEARIDTLDRSKLLVDA
ncbi:MAG: NAD-dependent epimerase/dehydratase family protein [Coriobacteriia bacterium]|nr:NAD-dependent epimerase/dehydratase family protein [Coriobacteriia bacterium]